ncbi:unnamed protein product [Orchesella dallaii]|uniref:Uncharacterized protein n=1 Tax=Orchesella dallaii TaxID=48710 RepID=A0ABP1RB36_9HEXA
MFRGKWKPLPIPIPQPVVTVAATTVAADTTTPAITTPGAATTDGTTTGGSTTDGSTTDGSTTDTTPTVQCLMGMGCYDAGGVPATAGCTGPTGSEMCPDGAGTTTCIFPAQAGQPDCATVTGVPDCSCAPVSPFPTG